MSCVLWLPMPQAWQNNPILACNNLNDWHCMWKYDYAVLLPLPYTTTHSDTPIVPTQLKSCCECAERFLGAYMVINTTATIPLSGELYCTTTEKKYLAWNEKLCSQLPHYSPLLAIRRLKVPLLTGTAALLSTCLRTVRTHKSWKKERKKTCRTSS